MRKVTVGSLLFAALVAASPASSQGTVRGAQEGAAEGGRAAGPVGAIVGGAVERLQVRSGASSAFKIDRDFTNMLSERSDLRIDISKKFELEPYYRRAGSPTMMYLQTIMSLGAIVTPS